MPFGVNSETSSDHRFASSSHVTQGSSFMPFSSRLFARITERPWSGFRSLQTALTPPARRAPSASVPVEKLLA